MTAPGSRNHRVVVLGGYGHFGAKISRGLARDCGVELVVAGRSRERGEAFKHELQQSNPKGTVRAAVLDHSAPDFRRALRALAPSIVLHTAGPFQGQDYRVAEACVELGSHYIDLADGRGFVTGFSTLDAAARHRGVLLVTGASTLPAVSSAAVDQLGANLASIERIETAILPANRTERGLGTVTAVFSYVGKPVPVLRDGEWTTEYGWRHLRWIDHPACARRAALCDVPDLRLFPDRYPGVKTVTFHAGLEFAWQQWGMWLMAWLARLGLVADWSVHAGLFTRLSARLVSLGGDVGGMQVRVTGRDSDARRVRRTWNLTAGSNHGPEIPCIAARVVAMKLARDKLEMRGAAPCMGMMSLDEFTSAVTEFDMRQDVIEHMD